MALLHVAQAYAARPGAASAEVRAYCARAVAPAEHLLPARARSAWAALQLDAESTGKEQERSAE